MQRFFWQGNLRFNEHVTYLCATVDHKLHALSRVSIYTILKKCRIIMSSFIICQFSYCPLIWMTNSKGLNNKIDHIHERALLIAYKDFLTSFYRLLAKDKFVTIHKQSLQQLAIEIFKIKMGMSSIIMKDVFSFSDNNR